jgi:CRISPR-associated protein Csd2
VCIKRKIRDFISVSKEGQPGFRIYIQKKDIALNAKHELAYAALGLTTTGTKQKKEDVDKARRWMCEQFFDVRTFGAVMTTGVNCGQVRGPFQLTFARSFDRVFSHDVTITRVAITKKEDADVIVGEDDKTKGKQTEMGRKALVPYGLYLGHGFFNPMLAEGTGFSDDDLKLFWNALVNMFELDRSASRGMMALRGLYIFTHDSKFGNAPAHRLFERVSAQLKDATIVPRKFEDYDVTVEAADLPEGVNLTTVIG